MAATQERRSLALSLEDSDLGFFFRDEQMEALKTFVLTARLIFVAMNMPRCLMQSHADSLKDNCRFQP